MKMSFRSLALILLTLALSGCATHKKTTEAAPAPAAEAVAAPAAPEVAKESVPEAPAILAEEKIPAAVTK
jgi:hypothetical protein